MLRGLVYKRFYSDALKNTKPNRFAERFARPVGLKDNRGGTGKNGVNTTTRTGQNNTMNNSTKPNQNGIKPQNSLRPQNNSGSNQNAFRSGSNSRTSTGGNTGPNTGSNTGPNTNKLSTKTTPTIRAKEYQQAREMLRNKINSQPKPNVKPKPVHQSKKQTKKPKEKVKISVPTFVSVSNLASILNIPLNTFLKNLASMGFENMRHNYILDKENVGLIADEYGFEINMNDDTGLDLFPAPELEPEDPKLKPRSPIVTIMGHVDHGKTTILDYLRKSSIVDKEFGGITQHIGAFSVITPVSKKKITFLDTPGHAAFLKMRERGANVTDIVILVVAADDSVMPQTIEAIKHAKKAGVPMIVAINKCDKSGVKVDKVLSDLATHDIDIEDYGGETQTVQVSGKTGLNMDKLEEAVITLSEMNDFKAETSGTPSEGWIIESEVVKGMGPVATVLVTRSTVKSGDFLVAGNTYCKVRGMKDEHGKPVKTAGPSTPVQIWGWKQLPNSGDQILQANTESIAKKVTENRINRQKELASFKDIESINSKRQKEIDELAKQEKKNELKLQGFTEEDLAAEFGEEQRIKTVNYIIKSDVFGSAEAIKESIEGLGNDEVKASIVSYEAGPPTDSDVDMAAALGAKILCFNVKVPKPVNTNAYNAKVDIREHNIIYRLIEEVTEDLSGQLEPVIETKILAQMQVNGVFTITAKNKKKVKVAGCKVSEGNLKRAFKVKVRRGEDVIFDGTLSSLKQGKEDVAEIKKGHECGLAFEGWDKFEEGDRIEAYELVTHKRFL